MNPTNITLQGRGGLSGQILTAGGPDLLSACKYLGLCSPGNAVITSGFSLPQHHVIHAVGPIWKGGTNVEPQILVSCYRAILARAKDHGLRSLGLPAISTGIFGYPIAPAAEVAVREIVVGAATAGLTDVIFACWDATTSELYAKELSRYK